MKNLKLNVAEASTLIKYVKLFGQISGPQCDIIFKKPLEIQCIEN